MISKVLPSHGEKVQVLPDLSGAKKLAAEIREMIFEPLLQGSWVEENEKTPALLIALRGTGLYFHVFEIYAKINWFKLGPKPIAQSFKPLSPSVLCNIRKVSTTCVCSTSCAWRRKLTVTEISHMAPGVNSKLVISGRL